MGSDGGLFIPEEIPQLPIGWETEWRDLRFEDLAFRIMSLYVSPNEVPPNDLKDIIDRSYSTFRCPERTPVVELDRNLHVLELFHGPTFAFKDVALQFLGNLFEYFLVRKNQGKSDNDRHRLTVIGATSGDTGSAAIYGLRGKKDASIFILFPTGRVSPIQQAQMTTVLDPNVHNLSVKGSFDDCQDIVKALFADPELNSTHNLAAVNSINWARILAQMTYYFYSYFAVVKSVGLGKGSQVRFIVPTGNFGDVISGWFAKQMGLPVEKLVIATNENDILDRFFRSGGQYTKDAQSGGVRETHSPAMDILVSSNFERLLWFLDFRNSTGSIANRRRHACESVSGWLNKLKSRGGFSVPSAIVEGAKAEFETEKVTNDETISTIRSVYSNYTPSNLPSGSARSSKTGGYIVDPHTAVGITASLRSVKRYPDTTHVSLATAHPAKFVDAVDLALRDEKGYDFSEVLPKEFVGLEQRRSRLLYVGAEAGWQGIRDIIKKEVEREVDD